jgi:hypothetical protein
MKYIITENKLHNAIYRYIDELFDDLIIKPFYDYETDIHDECCHLFKIENGNQIIFFHYKKCYWEREHMSLSTKRKAERIKNSPIIEFNDTAELNALNSYFGNLWIPVFKEWFENRFEFKVKTITID